MASRFAARTLRLAARAVAARAPQLALTGAVAVGAFGIAVCGNSPAAPATPASVDYAAVYKAIADKLDNLDYDDGSYGPLLVRLAWHASGSYTKANNTGGSAGAGMRWNPEAGWGGNAGLAVARDLLEPIKKQFPGISYGDLWTLAGVAAIQEMGGPAVPWRGGRSDYATPTAAPTLRTDLLPDATGEGAHLRSIFYRMGFNDQEIVALSGAHALGRCHPDRSGFVGPWTRAPTTFSNEYFVLLKSEKWVPKTAPNGATQYVDAKSGDLMMLTSDLALLKDPEFKKYVDIYAKDQARFFADFSAAFVKLLENGVAFPAGATPRVIPRSVSTA